MATMPNFKVEATYIHYAIEVPVTLLTWIEFGGMRPNGFPPNGSDPNDVAACDHRYNRTMRELSASLPHSKRSTAFRTSNTTATLGPMSIRVPAVDSKRVIDSVVQALRKAHMQMSRSGAYKQWLASKENTDMVTTK